VCREREREKDSECEREREANDAGNKLFVCKEKAGGRVGGAETEREMEK